MLTDRQDSVSALATKKTSVISQLEQNKSVISKIRNYLSTYLKIDDPKKIQILEPFEMQWYKHKDKS